MSFPKLADDRVRAFVTTEPAPMVEPLPMVTPGNIVTLPPIQQSSSMAAKRLVKLF
jgi:hypothetical protein